MTGRCLRIDDAHHPTLVHDGDPVGYPKYLIEVFRDHQNRSVLVALFDETRMDVLGGADVDATGWLSSDQHLRGTGELAGDDHLLDVAAGEILGGRLDARRLDGVLIDQSLAVFIDGREVVQTAPEVSGLVVVDQQHILGD